MTTRQVPKDAFKVSKGEVQFAATVNEDGSKSVPVKLVARSGQPISHWYWGKVVHDMSGLTVANPKIPLDWNHSDETIIGYADTFETETGDLVVSGELVSTQENDKADEIIKLAKAGVPFSSSIYFDSEQNFVVEELAEGTQAEVNGYVVSGPVTIIRQWMLRGVAITPHGYDWRTPVDASQFTTEGENETVTIEVTEIKQTDTEETQTVTEPSADETQNDANAEALFLQPDDIVSPEENQGEPVNSEPVNSELANNEVAKNEVARFVNRFGSELGATWFIEDKSYGEAIELYVDDLHRRLKEQEEENRKLKAKLAVISYGEAEPLSAVIDKTDNRFSNLGTNLAKFASGIKLPTK